MPEGVGYASSNVVAGTGLELNYVGNHCFAYSGVVSVDDTQTDLLNFQTGNKTIRAIIIFNSVTTDKLYLHKILFNEIIVQEYFAFDSGGRRGVIFDMIIPPYTSVRCTSENDEDNASKDQIVSLAGKLYE